MEQREGFHHIGEPVSRSGDRFARQPDCHQITTYTDKGWLTLYTTDATESTPEFRDALPPDYADSPAVPMGFSPGSCDDGRHSLRPAVLGLYPNWTRWQRLWRGSYRTVRLPPSCTATSGSTTA